MKQPVTLRLDPGLLAAARHCAEQENRTLTNFVETVLKQHIVKAQGNSKMLLDWQQKQSPGRAAKPGRGTPSRAMYDDG